jgi:hypothetical protein
MNTVIGAVIVFAVHIMAAKRKRKLPYLILFYTGTVLACRGAHSCRKKQHQLVRLST